MLDYLIKVRCALRCVFRQSCTLEEVIDSHACSLEALVHACDQWHSSRLRTPLIN
jgi:hypothetical protein